MSSSRKYRVMIDIETLGLKPGAGIWQIGAVTSDGDWFNVTVNPDAVITRQGPECSDPSTILWQENYNSKNWEAARGLAVPGPGTVNILPAEHFYSWARNYAHGKEKVEWWSKGNFDFPLIEASIRELQMDVRMPWKYSEIRELRTLMAVCGIYPTKEVAHDAYQDAVDQMEQLNRCLEIVKRGKACDCAS